MRIELPLSAAAAGGADFKRVLQQELQVLAAELPLQQGMSQGSYPLTDDVQVMLLSAALGPELIEVRVGVFFAAVIAGCSCADDPTPLDVVNEYCEFVLVVDRDSGHTGLRLRDGD